MYSEKYFLYCNNKDTVKSSREYSLDFIKGIGILLVVLVHSKEFSAFPKVVEACMNAIMLNCFFVVSGYLVYSATGRKWSDVKQMIIKKWKSLIIPYISFSVLVILWHIIICVGWGNTEVSDQYFGWNLIFRDVFCMFSGIGIGTLWFLPVLFISYTILIVLVVGVINRKGKYSVVVAVILFFIFAVAGQAVYYINYPENGMISTIISKYIKMIYRILNGTAYSIWGYTLHLLWCSMQKKRRRTALVGLAVLSCLGYFKGWKICFQSTICAVVLLFFTVLFDSSIREKMIKICKPVIFCGQNSLAIMIYHYLFLYPVEKTFIKIVFESTGNNVQEWILLVANLLSTIAVVYWLKDNPVEQRLLGKEKSRYGTC